jgi:hypothetical protein
MVRNGGWGSQTGKRPTYALLYWGLTTHVECGAQVARPNSGEMQRVVMVDRQIKAYKQQEAEEEAREAQRRTTLRNQAVGMVMLAAAALAWWLVHTRPGWIFPAGWWHW